jgi:hypothetical protein
MDAHGWRGIPLVPFLLMRTNLFAPLVFAGRTVACTGREVRAPALAAQFTLRRRR